MAEIFGIIAGSFSVAAVFNNAVDCFGYIQLGRNFGSDYQTCQLRLDIARLRLSRWGAAVDINGNARFAEIYPSDGQARTAKRTLEQILNLFARAYAESSNFKLTARAGDLALFDSSTNTNRTVVSLRNTMHELARKRQNRTSLSKKISWALYRQKHLDRLIDDIHELLDGLESIFQQDTFTRMAEVEVEEMSDAPRLEVLAQAAQDDPLLREAAARRLQMLGGNTIDEANVSGSSRVRVGNEYITQGSPGMNTGATINRIGRLHADGGSNVHVGDSFEDSRSQSAKIGIV